MPRVFAAVLLLLSASWPLAGEPHADTQWDLKPSLKYDALCLLAPLTGDPFYVRFYHAEYDYFNALFTPAERDAFHALKRILKDEAEGIVSASLALWFSSAPAETLDELIATAHDSSSMKTAFKQTAYWDEKAWSHYERARKDLEIALRALKRAGFEKYWDEHARPLAEKRIAELTPSLARYNIIPAIESRLGKALESNRITIYLLVYSKPHGIRITGTRFLTHYSYPFEIELHTAIHEMMHPPFDSSSPAIAGALKKLGEDPLIRDKVEHHDKSFGYNTVDGLADEDSVQALEAIIGEQFGVGRDQVDYWRMQDAGIHVIAVALYAQMKKAAAEGRTLPPFPEFFAEEVKKGDLTGAKLKQTLDNFFSGKTPDK